MGKLLNKEEKSYKVKKDKIEDNEAPGEDDVMKKNAQNKKITLHDFRSILTWENK
jgi:hypothetical protein